MMGFSTTNLWYMVQFYVEYHADLNLQPLVGEISWSKHVVILSKCKDSQERQFYTLATQKFGWTKDILIHQVEYCLKTASLPIGVATYTTSNDLPNSLKSLLPSAELISEKLAQFFPKK